METLKTLKLKETKELVKSKLQSKSNCKLNMCNVETIFLE